MNGVRLVLAHWRARPLRLALALLLVALGCATLAFALRVQQQAEARIERQLAGVDLLVGAKGSPMQIMLAGLFHLDVPTGNIALAEARALARHPMVAAAVPLALGDSVGGHRIVGSEPGYLDLYGAVLAQGRLWRQPLEAVPGAQAARRLGLAPGARFVGVHGLADSGHAHDAHPYTVVGVLAPCGCVLDGLVLTGLESVWKVHEDQHVDAADPLAAADRAVLEAEREVTLLLLRYRTPLAAAVLPRLVNARPGLQAASPAFESARLMKLAGVGVDLLAGFGAVVLLLAALALFVGLQQALDERRAELALLRLLGARPARLARLLAGEALALGLIGALAGLLAARGLTALLIWWSERSGRPPLGLDAAAPLASEAWVLAGGLLLALLAAAWPLVRVLRLDVTEALAERG
jgi:putative ABC transport system permease protein